MPNIRPSVIESVDSTIQSPYTLSLDQTVQGNISNMLDYDYYNFSVVAGQKYSFGLIGTGVYPMNDPILRILDSRGVEVASNDDLAAGYKWSDLKYTPTQSGILSVKVGSYGSDPGGQYGLSVTAGNQLNFDYFMGAGAVHSDASSSWSPGKGLGVTVTYGFRATGASYSEPPHPIEAFTKLTSAQIVAVNTVMSLWSDICGIKFQLVNPSGYSDNATILFGNYSGPSDAAGAFAYKPRSYASTSSSLADGDVWLNNASGGVSNTSLAPGGYSFNTIMHEVGHALGLSHPSPYQATTGSVNYTSNAKFSQDTGQYTIMSYFDNSDAGQASGKIDADLTPMMFDILAMQNLYGANMATRSGNTVYGFGSTAGSVVYEFNLSSAPQLCIWDAGGSDTLNCSGYSQNQSINLNEGSFSDIGGGTANISIALNVVLESAIGGSGNDQILGNVSNNTLTGGRGNDFINGGSGNDKAIYSGLVSSYTISAISGNSTISDKTVNRDGTDTLTNVERIKFTDTNIALDVGPTQNAGSVYMIYKAAFNRAPDAGGMGYWLAQKDAGSNIVTNIAQGFVNSAEFTAKYGTNPSNSTYIDKLYQNVLGRSGDAGGVAYWNQQLDNGSVSKAAALAAFATLPEGASNVASLIANGIPYTEFLGS